MFTCSVPLYVIDSAEREMFNQEFESGWREYLETLSDDELSAITPQSALCGLFDRVERVTRVYNEEIARRGLRLDSTTSADGP
jgi:hypothetical protein